MRNATLEKPFRTFLLEEGVNETILQVRALLETATRPVIILVAGGSASGKTNAVAKRIQEAFRGKSLLLSMDNYYHGTAFMEREASRGNPLNFDQPEVVDLNAVAKDIVALRNKQPISERIYSFDTGISYTTETLIFPRSVVIIEGLFALHDEIRINGDLRVFVEIEVHGRLLRRLLRDIDSRGNQSPSNILRYFIETVLPMHEQYVQPNIGNADIVIKNEYVASVEAGRSGTVKDQTKFRIPSIDSETMRRAGSEFLGRTEHIDTYLDLPDKHLNDAGESVRIREEGEMIIFGYKGPGICSHGLKRSTLEFEIDKETKWLLTNIYPRFVRRISKIRRLYRKGSLVFSLDAVWGSDGDILLPNLGSFLEIRTDPSNQDDQKHTDELLAFLSLDRKDAILTPYSEL